MRKCVQECSGGIGIAIPCRRVFSRKVFENVKVCPPAAAALPFQPLLGSPCYPPLAIDPPSTTTTLNKTTQQPLINSTTTITITTIYHYIYTPTHQSPHNGQLTYMDNTLHYPWNSDIIRQIIFWKTNLIKFECASGTFFSGTYPGHQ